MDVVPAHQRAGAPSSWIASVCGSGRAGGCGGNSLPTMRRATSQSGSRPHRRPPAASRARSRPRAASWSSGGGYAPGSHGRARRCPRCVLRAGAFAFSSPSIVTGAVNAELRIVMSRVEPVSSAPAMVTEREVEPRSLNRMRMCAVRHAHGRAACGHREAPHSARSRGRSSAGARRRSKRCASVDGSASACARGRAGWSVGTSPPLPNGMAAEAAVGSSRRRCARAGQDGRRRRTRPEWRASRTRRRVLALHGDAESRAPSTSS